MIRSKIRWVWVLYPSMLAVAFFLGVFVSRPQRAMIRTQAEQDSIVTRWQKEAANGWGLVQATIYTLENRKDKCDQIQNWQVCSWQFRDLQLRLYTFMLQNMPSEFRSDSNAVRYKILPVPQVPIYPLSQSR
jgi:hypothetical protein